MRLPTRRPISGQINMTPMIDVTFLLIIFFLLSSRLSQQEAFELELPEAASGLAAEREERPRVSVSVSPAGGMMIGNVGVSPEELSRQLSTERDRVGSDLEIRIRASRAVPYSAVEPILLACAEAGIWNVTFAVLERIESRETRIESRKL